MPRKPEAPETRTRSEGDMVIVWVEWEVDSEMKQWSAGSKETFASLSSLEVGFGARPMLRHGARQVRAASKCWKAVAKREGIAT